MNTKALVALSKAGYFFEYNNDECTTVFQKADSDQYMTGEFTEAGVNMSLHDSFFNRVVYENDEQFIRDFEATFNRLVEEYGMFEGGQYFE